PTDGTGVGRSALFRPPIRWAPKPRLVANAGVDHPTRGGAGVGRSALFRPPIRCAPRHPRHARRPTLRWPRLTPLIQLGFTHRPSLVTAVTPQVLLGRFAELFLHPLVDAQAIRFLALAGEVVQRRMDHQAI